MLMDIDYKASMDCPCHGSEGIVVDGFNMSVNKKHLDRFSNLHWDADLDGPIVRGSAFADREFFVPETRRLLFRLCRSRKAKESGLTFDELEELKTKLETEHNGSFKALLVMFP